MTKRYHEPLQEIECEGRRPAAFAWRGRHYRVTGVLGHWREDAGWWCRPDGASVRIEQADRWRVEARRTGSSRPGSASTVPVTGDTALVPSSAASDRGAAASVVDERAERAERDRPDAGPVVGRGVYELVCRGGSWRLDRIWD